MAVAAAIYPDLKYSPTKSFVPLAMIANFPLIMVIAADNPSKNLKEFVDWMKAHPDKANYASSSPAFTITTELLKLKSGMPGTMIPYKSSNEMNLTVIQGQTAMTIADGPPTVPQVKGGKVRALAVTGAERSAELPDVPSMAEAGYPSVDVHLWSGMFAPTGDAAGRSSPSCKRRCRGDRRSRRVGKAQGDGGQSRRRHAGSVQADHRTATSPNSATWSKPRT